MEEILIGTTDRTILVFIPDPASTDGSGKTGLTAADLTVSYTRVETDNDVTVSDVTSSLSTLSALTDAHTDWGVKEVSSTLAPGLYRLDVADAVFASGAWYAVVYVMITSSAAAATPKAFKLVNFDMFGQSATDLKDFADTGYDPSTHLAGADLQTIKTQTVTCAGGVTIPAATLASTTNITAGTITTVTTLTNAPLDSSGTTTLLSRLTSSRAAALDFLDVAVSSRSEHTAADIWLMSTRTLSAIDEDVTTLDLDATIRAAIATELGRIDVAVSSRLAGASYTTPPTVTQIRQEMDSNSTDLDAIGALATAINAKTTNLPASPAATGDIPTAAQNATAVLTTVMTEAYRGAGAAPTLAQFCFEVIAHLGESSITGTTKTLKKLDGSTTAKTYTLNSSSTPTSITETT